MWLKWLPWRYLIRSFAQKRGFIDPLAVLARLEAVSQPAEVVAPLELLRAGLVLHARGFINNQIIEHNLDWVWPLWVERQFDPAHGAFLPRGFSMTHLNLTQRNWTAVGCPGCAETPILDGRGLLMPFFDSWSLDAWFIADDGDALIPSRMESVSQRLETQGNLRVITESEFLGMRLSTTAMVGFTSDAPVCSYALRASSPKSGWLVASLRPYNPEGISFVNDLSLLPRGEGWKINREHEVRFSRSPNHALLSRYHDGDVYLALVKGETHDQEHVVCDVGMATGAVLYRVEAGGNSEVTLTVPLGPAPKKRLQAPLSAEVMWSDALQGGTVFSGGPGRFASLYETARRTVLLLSPGEIYAGPYTYKRFWFRDAAIILHALICAGYRDVAERAIEVFIAKQSASGYFVSQSGEWDSNGQVLWAMGRFCRVFNAAPKADWLPALRKAVRWIRKKRADGSADKIYSGLMPAGFSAEHLGPNDYYYWDDFWTVAGLRLAAEMLGKLGDGEGAHNAVVEAEALSQAVDDSLARVAARIGTIGMPASPHRRMDSGSIGSVAVGFPLQLWPARDERLAATLDYLCRHCLLRGALYHDITHSGINPYLSLHLAQCLLRAGDPRFQGIMQSVADLASDTGQWPEAMHPSLGTGCMGDGQHAWAAAEWMMMVRNCFLYEEEYSDKLVLGAGLTEAWCDPATGRATFGPAPTRFGNVSVTLETKGDDAALTWSAEWFGKEPEVEIRFDPAEWKVVSNWGGHCALARNKRAV